jgi:uncharacterized protein (TIGR02145 family)
MTRFLCVPRLLLLSLLLCGCAKLPGDLGVLPTISVHPAPVIGGVTINGTLFQTVTIGTQVWMVENLKTTIYNDGTPIPLVTNSAAWEALTTPGFCWYGNDSAHYNDPYGALYNWYAVNTGKLAPQGWHVATDSDWEVMQSYLIMHGYNYDGTTDTSNNKIAMALASPNYGWSGAVKDSKYLNSSGFSALPGGVRYYDYIDWGSFDSFGVDGNWWTATDSNSLDAYGRGLYWYSDTLHRGAVDKRLGLSVRLVQNTNSNPPSAPVMDSAVVGNASVTVTWNSVTDATSYNLYYAAGTTVTMTTATKATGVTSPKQVIGLTNGTQYAFAVSAVNAAGESGLSGVQTATPQAGGDTGTVTDTDGNVYQTVTIGTQVWMKENLKTTRYNDGSPIPLVTVGSTWINLTTGGYCWYNDSIAYGNTYGALYNWYAVNTGKLAPKGWHVPSDSEWTVLTTYLGGASVAGGKLKEVGTTHWGSPNTGATNETGFTALPGGVRDYNGTFSHIGSYGFWWSSTALDAASSWARFMSCSYADVSRSDNGSDYDVSGFSVRCVKNTNANPPSAPVMDSAVAASSGVTVTWNSVTGATSYNLYYKAGTTVDKATGTKVTGAVSPKQVTNLANGTQYAFAVTAVNAAGESVLSAVLTATPASPSCIAPSIANQTRGQNVTAPAPASFSVTAGGTGPFSYQWQRAEPAAPTTFANVSTGTGGTAATYTTAATTISDNGTVFRCLVTNGCPGSVTSDPAPLTVTPAGGTTVTDIDGNVYHTITIGTQTWMVENLKTTRYNDGSAIPLVTNNAAWAALTKPGYCWYNNDSAANKNTYGALYNWYAATATNLAPAGWRVPSDSDWTTLTTFIGDTSTAGGKLKEAGTIHWASPNAGASNSFGFSAVPGGSRYDPNGEFTELGTYTWLWSATAHDPSYSWERYMEYDNAGAGRSYAYKYYGFSVRCVKNTGSTPPSAPSISSATAGDSSVTVSWNAVAGATSYNLYYAAGTTVTTITGTKVTGVTSPKQVATLTNGTQYAFAVSAVNAGGESGLSSVQTATPQAVTVIDTDGNVYHTVTIGTQVWMVENLKTTRYNDGAAIPLVTDPALWATITTDGYCWYNNDSAVYGNTYGALYDWYAVNTGKLAPTGWHVPSDAEWEVLGNFLGGDNLVGGPLKEAGMTHWASPNTGATNATGFSARPGGMRGYSATGTYSSLDTNGFWWSSTGSNDYNATFSWKREMDYNSASLTRTTSGKQNGFSVRCVKD